VFIKVVIRCNFLLGRLGKSEQSEDDDSEQENILDSFESELVQSDPESSYEI